MKELAKYADLLPWLLIAYALVGLIVGVIVFVRVGRRT